MGKLIPQNHSNPATKRGWKFLGRLEGFVHALTQGWTQTLPCWGTRGSPGVLSVELLQPASKHGPSEQNSLSALAKAGNRLPDGPLYIRQQQPKLPQRERHSPNTITLEEENLPVAEVPLLVSFCLRVLAPEESQGNTYFEGSIVPVPLRDPFPDSYFASFLPGPWVDCQTQGIISLVFIYFSAGKFLEKN